MASSLRAIGEMLYFHYVILPQRIRPTAEGVAFIIVTLLIGFAALNTGAQLLYLMFSLMCGFMILSAVLANANLQRTRVRREMPTVVEAGRRVRGRIRVENLKRRIPTCSLRVEDRMSDERRGGVTFFDVVAPKGEGIEEYEIVFPRRGMYSLDSIEIRTRFPFGLIERGFAVKQRQEVLALPPLANVEQLMQSAEAELGDLSTPRRGQGSGLFNIRKHQHGDSSRSIHWKLSARRGELLVREFESEESRRVSVVLDNRAQPDVAGGREDFERAVVLAASAISWLCDHGHDVELRTSGGMIGFGTGPSQSARCRRALALIAEAAANAPIQGLGPSDAEATVVYIGWGTRRIAASRGVLVLETELVKSALDEALHPEDLRRAIMPTGEAAMSSGQVSLLERAG